jgi:hypothetical protein
VLILCWEIFVTNHFMCHFDVALYEVIYFILGDSASLSWRVIFLWRMLLFYVGLYLLLIILCVILLSCFIRVAYFTCSGLAVSKELLEYLK